MFFSLLKCFLQKKIANYWFESGTPTFLIRQMQHFRTDITSMDHIEADASAFDPANGDFTPTGSAIGAGVYDSDVSHILGNYTKDLAGNPRTVDGKINLGCYQAQ